MWFDLTILIMKILLIGSGGREHALACKISESPNCSELFIAPGNPGTDKKGKNVTIAVDDIEGIRDFCVDNDIDLVVVGPEAPLVDGITDTLSAETRINIGVIGPDSYSAQLEGSKSFAKNFMQKHGIPTAAFLEVTSENIDEGKNFLSKLKAPYVLKADGLAAGKGVLIIDDLSTAQDELEEMLSGKFGAASQKVVIEEFLDGIEFSVFVLTDGKNYVLLPEAKDYKRIGENDTGLNTGGMGAVSPVPFVDKTLWEKVISKIVIPTINGIYTDKMNYTGFVFFGLINVDGEPFVIEYNCRLGDPETEAILPRLENDIVSLFSKAIDKRLDEETIKIRPQSAATIVMVSGGYPEKYEKDKEITGIDSVSDSIVYHAGTSIKDGSLVTSGGRVLAITSMADNFTDAVQQSLDSIEKIEYEGKYFRRDIGSDLM